MNRHAMSPEEAITAAHGAMIRALADTEMDTPERAERRMQIVFGVYDDEEPHLPIQDLLTDVLHECERRGVYLYDVLPAAEGMARQEREEWAERAR